ncbi:MAG: hypothetical protein K6V73_10200 [Firmicutes bacterium]|nr:hypothetical protein [Bacillota bacterium]
MAARDGEQVESVSALPAWLGALLERAAAERGVSVQAVWRALAAAAPSLAPAAAADAPPWLRMWAANACRYAREADRHAALEHEYRGLERLEAAWDEAAQGGGRPEDTRPPAARRGTAPALDGWQAFVALVPADSGEDRERIARLALAVAALRSLALGPPVPAAREAFIRDAAELGAQAGALHFRSFELQSANQVMAWHIAGARAASLRGRADPVDVLSRRDAKDR